MFFFFCNYVAFITTSQFSSVATNMSDTGLKESLWKTYQLNATKDIWLEGDYSRSNYDFLIIGKHPGYLKKRTLLQFQDIPSDCTNVISAKMYLWYWYSHKASWLSSEEVPFLNHTFKVHQIKKEWSETQATSTHHKAGIQWSQPYLALDGTDADANAIDSVFFPSPPPTTYRWIEFNITEAAKNWNTGQPNYGVVIWSTRENENGQDVHFYSCEHDINRPYIEIQCGSRSISSALKHTSSKESFHPSFSSDIRKKSLTPYLIMSLQATQDVWLEGYNSKSNYDFLIIGKHPGYLKKRSLLQFQDIPSGCTNVISAKMYLWYWYSHKASWLSNKRVPFLSTHLMFTRLKKNGLKLKLPVHIVWLGFNGVNLILLLMELMLMQMQLIVSSSPILLPLLTGGLSSILQKQPKIGKLVNQTMVL